MIRPIAKLSVVMLVVGCGYGCTGSEPASSDEAHEVIGPNGGVVILPDGSSVSVPPGALDAEVTISMQVDSSAPAPSEGTPIGLTYLLGPEGQQFNLPVTVTLAFDPAELSPGDSADGIVTFTAPRASPNYTPLTTTVADSRHVSSTTTHFSHVVPVVHAGNPAKINIGFSGNIDQFSYYADFFHEQASYLSSNPGPRLCHIYLPWNVACADSSCTSSKPAAIAEATETTCAGAGASNAKTPEYLACWLREAQGKCDEALVTFKGNGFEKEDEIHFESSFAAFLATPWQSLTGFKGSFAFTPWNEPNNPAPAGNGLCQPAKKDGKNVCRSMGADEAAKYYLIAEHLCEAPGKDCKVAAGDFASNGSLWQESEPKPGDYLASYKAYILAHHADAAYRLKSPYPKYFAFHGWSDINDFLDKGSLCTDSSTCETRLLLASLSGKGWASAELWNTETGVGQGLGKDPKKYDSAKQACGAAFLLRLTALDKRITRIYYMRLSADGSGTFPQELEVGHGGSVALDVLASRSPYFAGRCWTEEDFAPARSYVAPIDGPPSGYFNVYETTAVGGIGLVQGAPLELSSAAKCSAGANKETDQRPEPGSGQPSVICVDDTQRFQRVVGFGASITDSAAYDIAYHLDGSERPTNKPTFGGLEQKALLGALFGARGGIGLSLLRQPLGASDFTHDKTPYALVDKDAKESAFSISHDEAYIIPTILQALKVGDDRITVVGTPWSAPAWMKQNDSMLDGKTGSLKSGKPGGGVASYLDDYAAYLKAAVDGYRNKNVPISYLTPLNEPGNGAGYPGMHLTEDDEQSLIVKLHADLPDVHVLGYDNNWAEPETGDPAEPNPFDLLKTGDALAGLAFHCYAGSPETMTTLHGLKGDAFHLWVTECTSAWNDENAMGEDGRVGKDAVRHGHGEAIEQLIRSMRNWSETFATWNMALGPDLENPREKREHEGTGCNDCIGVVRIENGTWKPERDFAELGHASAFVTPQIGKAPGATVVYSDTYSDYVSYTGSEPKSGGGIEDVAFVNPDGTHVLVVYNSATSARPIQVLLGGQGLGFTYEVGARSALTFTWGGGSESTPKVSSGAGDAGPKADAGTPPASTTVCCALCQGQTSYYYAAQLPEDGGLEPCSEAAAGFCSFNFAGATVASSEIGTCGAYL